MVEILLLIGAYLIGSVPTAVWVSKGVFGMDIREYGSGNAGATNTFRVLGPKWGTIVMAADMIKGIIAVKLALLLPAYFGSEIRLQYEEGRPPVLAVRIQEVFGMAETPRIAGGRVRVLMHLLAPNMRPQQVTDDLKSFWDNAYSEVRKDLRRRYPKHQWPENPRDGIPRRRPGHP